MIHTLLYFSLFQLEERNSHYIKDLFTLEKFHEKKVTVKNNQFFKYVANFYFVELTFLFIVYFYEGSKILPLVATTDITK